MSAQHGRRGSVRQDANGTWSFVVDAKDESGKRRQTRRRGFATRRVAQAELTRVLSSLADNTYVSPQTTTVGEFLVGTWLPAIEHTIKPATFESYRRNVRLHVAGRLIGRRRLQDVEPADLNALYSLLLRGDDRHRALSGRSVAYIAAIIHRALRDAVRWQLIVRNPADFADPPRPVPASQMRTWSAAELKTFLDGIAEDRLAGAWWLLATTGMRRGEVLGLRWRDVDLAAGVLQVSRTLITTDVQRKGMPGMEWGTPKTRKCRRRIALDPRRWYSGPPRPQNQERLAFASAYSRIWWSAAGRPSTRSRCRTTSRSGASASSFLGSVCTICGTPAALALRAGCAGWCRAARPPTCRSPRHVLTCGHQMQADAAASRCAGHWCRRVTGFCDQFRDPERLNAASGALASVTCENAVSIGSGGGI